MNNVNHELIVKKLATGIASLDEIALGGLPEGRTTLVVGTSGSAKTVLAAQFLAEGILRFDQPGVFVTFEERPEDIRGNMASLGWDIAQWEREGRWVFVDAAIQAGEQLIIAGSYDLGALMARIDNAVKKVGAKRLVLDSIGTMLTRFPDSALIRSEMHRIISALKKMGITAIITGERIEEYGEISRHGVEEFVSDNVIVMRNVLENAIRSRTIEILKFRGAPHRRGEHPFTVVPGSGIAVLAPLRIDLGIEAVKRLSFGKPELDQMCGGGLFQDSVTLLTGPSGGGKTLLACEFISGGLRNGERCALFCFEENREQLLRNAGGWGMDFAAMEQAGRLKLVCVNPESAGLVDHLIQMKQLIEDFQPQRFAVDSLSALERIGNAHTFHHFKLEMGALAKSRGIAIFVTTTASLNSRVSYGDSKISSQADNVIVLHYVELFGEIHHGLTLLKSRGSDHDRNIREFTIDGSGLHLGKAFRFVSGILTGTPKHEAPGEVERMGEMFSA